MNVRVHLRRIDVLREGDNSNRPCRAFTQYTLYVHLRNILSYDALSYSLLFTLTGALAHTSKSAARLPKLTGRAKLYNLPVIKDKNPIKVGYGTEAVRDDNQSFISEPLADTTLDQGIGGHVDGRGCLVQHDDFGVSEEGTGDAEKLLLSLRQVSARLGDGA